MIEAFVRLMASKSTLTGPINLGNPVEFKISELAMLVIELTNSNSKIIYKSLPEDDPKKRQPDISLAKIFKLETSSHNKRWPHENNKIF